MPTITSGSSVTLSLAESDSVLVSNAANSEGTITVTRNGQSFTGIGSAIAPATNKFGPPPSSRVVGPFGIQSSVTISCATGSVDYTVTPVGQRVLAQSAIPVILAPNGTVAADGTITLGTALPAIYPNAWVYLPAGAVVGGAAGLYYTTFTSTTVGSVKTNYVSPGSSYTPVIPSTTVAAVGSGSAYTQTTAADVTLANINVPGGLMGTNGALRVITGWTTVNNANAKPIKHLLGGSVFGGAGITLASNAGAELLRVIRNAGVLASQKCIGSSSLASLGAGGGTYTTVNTAVDQPLTFTGQLAVATDFIILEGYNVEVLPG